MALTIHQPYAWLIVNGYKDIENRDFPPSPRLKLLAIHAGIIPKIRKSRTDPNKYTQEQIERVSSEVREKFGIPVPSLEELTFGAFLGTADISGVHRRDDPSSSEHGSSYWRNNASFGWILRNATRLDEPIPKAGRQGVWPIPNVARSTMYYNRESKLRDRRSVAG